MKHKCLDCGHVGEPAIWPPKLSRDGSESQTIPNCAKCGSGKITRVG